MSLYIAELLGKEGEDFKQYTLDGFKAFIQRGYNFSDNTVRPMFSDGTDLTDYPFARNGYYGPKGFSYKKQFAAGRFMLSAVRAYIASKDDLFWKFAVNIGRFNGLGDIGTSVGENMLINEDPLVNDRATNVVKFDEIEPLALLTLYAAIENKSEYVPKFIHGEGLFMAIIF